MTKKFSLTKPVRVFTQYKLILPSALIYFVELTHETRRDHTDLDFVAISI